MEILELYLKEIDSEHEHAISLRTLFIMARTTVRQGKRFQFRRFRFCYKKKSDHRSIGLFLHKMPLCRKTLPLFNSSRVICLTKHIDGTSSASGACGHFVQIMLICGYFEG